MLIEDATEKVRQAVDLLLVQRFHLGLFDLQVRPLEEFEAEASKERLNRAQRETIVEQAIVLIEQLYAHLQFKRTRYAINPAQRLRLLRHRLGELNERAFHAEMLAAFNELRDAHTHYGLPQPYRGSVAFLPFLLASCMDHGRRRFVVVKTMAGFDPEAFHDGVEVTLWNGMPMALAIERLADQTPGGNASARWARGLSRMTMRPLTFSPLPDERMAYVQYTSVAGGEPEERTIALPWYVGSGWGVRFDSSKEESRSACMTSVETVTARRVLWFREELIRCRAIEEGGQAQQQYSLVPQPEKKSGYDLKTVSRHPSVFEFQYAGSSAEGPIDAALLTVGRRDQRRLAYLRVRTFDLAEDAFVEEFRRILMLLDEKAPDGLILDIRENPGGSIRAGERVLQMLTPKEVVPALFHFSNTTLMQEIASELSRLLALAPLTKAELRPWIQDILDSVAGGDMMTGGKPLTQPEAANDIGQIYQGPVALIVDGRVFSAAEIFAGGFQDHGIGPVIGTAASTGGGGANRWLHDELISRLKEIKGLPLAPLPGGATLTSLPEGAAFGLAIRRSTRVGPNAGCAIEDVGVRADIVHEPALDDLLSGDRVLIRRVCAILGKRKVRRLRIDKARLSAKKVDVTANCRNLDRLECFIDQSPQCAVSVSGRGTISFAVPLIGLSGKTPRNLLVRGYTTGKKRGEKVLAASAAVRLKPTRR